MAQLTIPNTEAPASIPGKASRKAIVIQNRHTEAIYLATVKADLTTDATNGIKLTEGQSFTISGLRGEAAISWHVAKEAGVGDGSINYVEVV